MKAFAVGLTLMGALAAPALAHAGAPPIARPNPVTYPIRLDYESPLPGSNGKPTLVAPLATAVIMAATIDEADLAYEKLDDLGGFTPAPVGKLTLTTGGHDVLAPGVHKAQIPLFENAAGGKVQSFTFTGAPPSGPTPAPDNGTGSPPPPPPTPGNSVPPANQGFGGQANGSGPTSTGGEPPGGTTTTGGNGGSGGTTTTTRRPPPATTTTTTATPPATTTTTTTTATTTGGGGGGGGGGGSSGCSGGTCAAGSCGTAGIQIDSNLPGCVLTISNAVPGDSASEILTITNTTGAPYSLGIKATFPHAGHVWQDLEMDVFDPLVGPASPLPSLVSWSGAFNTLTTLNAGQTVQYEIELYLPTTAGNADQGQAAVVAFVWDAQG